MSSVSHDLEAFVIVTLHGPIL